MKCLTKIIYSLLIFVVIAQAKPRDQKLYMTMPLAAPAASAPATANAAPAPAPSSGGPSGGGGGPSGGGSSGLGGISIPLPFSGGATTQSSTGGGGVAATTLAAGATTSTTTVSTTTILSATCDPPLVQLVEGDPGCTAQECAGTVSPPCCTACTNRLP